MNYNNELTIIFNITHVNADRMGSRMFSSDSLRSRDVNHLFTMHFTLVDISE